MKILVVSEGPTDFPIIKGVISAFAEKIDEKISVQSLAPRKNKTGVAETFGWTGIKKWCEHYSTNEPENREQLNPLIRASLERKNWRALVAASNADLLMIQMDTDIVGEIDGSFDASIHDRKEICKASINSWLGVDVDAENTCYYLLPTYATETWIMATYDHETSPHVFSEAIANYEDIDDVEDKLIALGYPSKLKNGKRRLRKKESTYRDNPIYLPRLISALDKALLRCQELQSLQTLVHGSVGSAS